MPVTFFVLVFLFALLSNQRVIPIASMFSVFSFENSLLKNILFSSSEEDLENSKWY